MTFIQFIEKLHQEENWQDTFKAELNALSQLTDVQSITKLIELFKIDSTSLDAEEVEELVPLIEQNCINKTEHYAEIINDISIALSELMYLRHSVDKAQNPIDIKRFCAELLERGLVIHPTTSLIAALNYVYRAIQTNTLSHKDVFRIGELVQSARLGHMCWQLIDSNAVQFNPVVKNSEASAKYQELEPVIRKQVHIVLTKEPEVKQLGSRVKKWLQQETGDQFILDDAPNKWFKRIIDEEKYFFDSINHFPIWQ